jgi:peroxiredoxin Q/BCP
MKLRVLGVTIMLSFLTGLFASASTDLKVGDPAPLGQAKNQEGVDVNLKDHYGSGYTLVYFYPKADTPGCTAQACSLRDSFADLKDKGVTVFGVSTDKVVEQKKFRDKYRLPFDLLSDTEKTLAEAFGVPVRFGISSRQAFLMKEGKVVWLDRTASTKKQAEDVLKVIGEQQ